ncbi:MAG: DNA topoisomerase 3 [Acetatifactor muris]|nr:DNA topoisomerase 3 [Acetatifactor muris]
MYLVIGEKPSVAQTLAKVLKAGKKEDGYFAGEECLVSWCFGHLAEYASPEGYDGKYEKWDFEDLPIIPKEWKLVVAKDKKSQLAVLKKLLNRKDLSYVVNACDAGREGELIFKHVYDLSGSTLPVKRLWISSMEDSAVREGFKNLKDGGIYGNIREASVCRAKADWLVGMNATRAYTTKYFKKLAVGRVQTPTLAMLVGREEKIRNFKKEKYFAVHISCGGVDAVAGRIDSREEAEKTAGECRDGQAQAVSVEKEEKTILPPKLYDLTTLQRDANRIFGFTAKETLEYLQNLYEKKLATYPRTDSRFLTDDMGETAGKVVDAVFRSGIFTGNPAGDKTFTPDIGRILDSRKVSDHHAVIPTVGISEADLSALAGGERKILLLISNRLLCATGEKHLYETVKAEFSCNGHIFTASGKTVTHNGWKDFEEMLKTACKMESGTDNGDMADGKLPELSKGQLFENVEAGITEHFTSAPKHYTEDQLLLSMETAGKGEFEGGTEKKGLGTPATRAGIIEKLVSSGYAERKGRQILPTGEGTELIAVMPEYLKSAGMTAEWENDLLRIERGELSAGDFMQGITELVEKTLEGCREIPEDELRRFHKKKSTGECPVCGAEVYEGKKNFYCGNKDCRFSLWKENRYLSGMKKKIDKKTARELLKTGRSRAKDLYSAKKDGTFEADIVMKIENERVDFHLEFPPKKEEKKQKGKKAE